jgi:transposase
MSQPGARRARIFRSGSGPLSSQPDLYPPSVDDLLPEDHVVRVLLALVEDAVGESLRAVSQDRGGFLHDPCRMFAVWMYGYVTGCSSSRRLEEACKYDVRFAFLSGGTRPDHTTLSRFRDNLRHKMPGLLVQVSAAGASKGRVSGQIAVVDGTKIAGVSSQWRRKVESSVEADVTADGEARTMRSGPGAYVRGYNSQVAVDLESGFILGQTTSSEANDYAQMEAVLMSIVDSRNPLPEKVVADAGYDSSLNHQAMETLQVASFVCPQRHHVQVFQPDSEGILRCRAGYIPSLTQTTKRGILYDVHRVNRCRKCPHRTACRVSPNSPQKEMTVRSGTRLGAREANQARAESDEGQQLLRLRGPTIELVFARIKQLFGFRRFKLSGLRGASLEFALVALSYNFWLLGRAFLRAFGRLLGQNPMFLAPKIRTNRLIIWPQAGSNIQSATNATAW